MPAYLERQSQIRQIAWARTDLWDIRFPDDGDRLGAPPPFDQWFPATDVEENILTLETMVIQGPFTTFEIPFGSSVFTLNVTFYDDQNHTLLNWLDEWVNKVILGDGQYVLTLSESVKRVMVAKLNARKDIVKETSYLVFPKGAVNFHGTSQGEALQYSVPFIIAG